MTAWRPCAGSRRWASWRGCSRRDSWVPRAGCSVAWPWLEWASKAPSALIHLAGGAAAVSASGLGAATGEPGASSSMEVAFGGPPPIGAAGNVELLGHGSPAEAGGAGELKSMRPPDGRWIP